MTLHDAIASELPFLRAQAESLMTDTFAAYSPGPPTKDADDFEVPGFTSEGSTFGKVSGPSAQSGDTVTRTVTVGGVERPVVSGGLHIPVGAPAPSIGWEYQCVAVGELSDLGLLGRRYRVVGVPMKSLATARRLDVVEVPTA